MTETNLSYSELKAHYLAVKKRLGGLGPSAGLVPPAAILRVDPPKPVEPVQVEPEAEEEKPLVLLSIDGIPKNNFWRILNEVAHKHGIDPNLLLHPKRQQKIVWIRREAIWRACREENYSILRVARWLRRDHTTIIHDLRCWESKHVSGA